MLVRAFRTGKVLAGQKTIFEVLDEAITGLEYGSIVVITSKVVSLCENRVAPKAETDKAELIRREADFFLPATLSKYGHNFTITRNTLAAVSGIDESNSSGDYYVLWPADAQKSANQIRKYLSEKFKLSSLGVIISDSTTMPMRWGTIGIPLAYSGFQPTHNYIGKPDLFGKPFVVSRGGVALGLTAAAVAVMGEGTEQTPIAVISDASFVKFQDHDPTKEELENFYIANYKEDLYEPFLSAVNWQKGGRSK